jgi:hypothetical protein
MEVRKIKVIRIEEAFFSKDCMVIIKMVRIPLGRKVMVRIIN